MHERADHRTTERIWQGVILFLSAGVILFTTWCLVHNITTIFMHLYYFPIVLLAYHYRWRGFAYAAVLSLTYPGLILFFSNGQPDLVTGAFYRFAVFVGIAAIIAWLSDSLFRTQQEMTTTRLFQESIIANANIWITVLATDGTILLWNNAAERISGYQRADVEGKKDVWKKMYPDPDYRKQVTREINRIIGLNTYLEDFETHIQCADGSKKTLSWNTGSMKALNGDIGGYIAIGRDVTAQKDAESRAEESSHFLSTIIDTLPVPVFFKDTEGKYLGCNPPFEEYIGIRKTDLIGRTAYDISPKELADRYTAADREVFRTPAPQRYETQVQYADGSRHDVIFFKAPFFSRDGAVAGLIGTFLDITERKRREEEILLSNITLVTQQETSPDGILVVNEAGKILSYNRRFVEVLGIPDDIIAQGDDELVLSFVVRTVVDPEEFLARVNYLYEHRNERSHEEIRLRNGNIVERYSSPMQDRDGRYFGRIWYFHDVTERKKAEEGLRESQQLFSDIISFLPDPTFVIDKEGRVLAWNRALEQLSGIKSSDIVGKGDHEYSIWQYGKRRPILIDLVQHPYTDAARLNYTNISLEGSMIMAQTYITMPTGARIELSLVASPLLDSQGRITGAIESMRDITRIRETERQLEKLNTGLEKMVRDRTRALEEEVTVRKQAEAAIQASLDEKILLLREIHHRVKNNLQIIISLTNLQMRTVDDPRMKQVMAEIRNRVRAMSIVHEKLYQSENIASIDLAEYTKYLSTQLFSFYGIDHRRVGLETDIEKIPLDINTAIPLGLILNELISNSLKHAFPDDHRGTLFISGHEQGDEITIVVRDDGAGLPADLNWKETDSLGLRLINSLVDQLGAIIEKGDGGGTMFIIRFHRKRDQGSAG